MSTSAHGISVLGHCEGIIIPDPSSVETPDVCDVFDSLNGNKCASVVNMKSSRSKLKSSFSENNRNRYLNVSAKT